MATVSEQDATFQATFDAAKTGLEDALEALAVLQAFRGRTNIQPETAWSLIEKSCDLDLRDLVAAATVTAFDALAACDDFNGNDA